MNHVTSHTGHKKTKKSDGAIGSAVEAVEAVEEQGMEAVRERFEQVKDLAIEVRDVAQKAFEEKPYLIPVAAGVAGLGVGLLLGSRVTRFLAVAAVGTLLSDVLSTQVKRIGKDLLSEIEAKLGEGEGDTKGIGVEPVTPAAS